MKNVLTIIICLFFIYTPSFGQYFYYYSGEKVPLQLNTQYIYLVSKTVSSKGGLGNAIGGGYELINTSLDKTYREVISIAKTSKKEKTVYRAIAKLGNQMSEDEYFEAIGELSKLSDISYAAPCYLSGSNKRITISHQFYVKLKDPSDTAILIDMAGKAKTVIIGQNQFMPLWYILSCDKNSSGNSIELANQFYETGKFVEAQPEFYASGSLASCTTCTTTVDDPFYTNQWNLQNTGQASPLSPFSTGTCGIDIDVCPAWAITKGDPSIITAILDDGVDASNPDISANIASSGFDVTTSGSSVIQTNPSPGCTVGNPGCMNDPEHATEVAGIIAAQQNNMVSGSYFGITGVAPNSSLVSVSIDFNSVTDMEMASGIAWAWGTGNASILNISWVHPRSATIKGAINDALTSGRGGLGCVVVCAAGNSDMNVEFPASMSAPGPSSQAVPISVGGIDRCGFQAGESAIVPSSCDPWTVGTNASDFGDTLAVVAPASVIFTTVDVGDGLVTSPDFTNQATGTSFAAPHVAGIAALLLSQNPCLTTQQVSALIESTCQQIDGTNASYSTTVTGRPFGGWSSLHGYGLVDAYAALTKLMSGTLFLQDNTETSTVIRANLGPILAGSNVTLSESSGPYTISSTANVEIKSTQSITFEPGFVTQPGAIMLAHIESFDGDCSTWPSTVVFDKTSPASEIQPTDKEPLQLSRSINIYPNPFKDNIELSITVSEDATPIIISITDITGRLIYENSALMNSGNKNWSINLPSSSSIYIAHVCAGNDCTTQKLVKYASY